MFETEPEQKWHVLDFDDSGKQEGYGYVIEGTEKRIALVVSGHLRRKRSFDGHRVELRAYGHHASTRVWEKRDGEWREHDEDFCDDDL